MMADSILVTQIVQGNAFLTNRLYQLLSTTPGNVFFSPFSIHAVLSMAYQGSEGKTTQILAGSLKVPDVEKTARAYKSLLDEVKNIDKGLLLMAYKIYVRKHEVFKEKFEKSVRECFYSEVEYVDFERKKEAVGAINKWVEDKTGEKIKNVIDEDSLDEETAMLLINAIYFKADWMEQFRESKTTSEKFFLDSETTVDVLMMNMIKTSYYRYDEELEAQIVGLPFLGCKFFLFVLLPKEINGIKNLETKLSSFDLSKLTENLTVVDADLSLPKFKLEADVDLNRILREMGLQNIFDENVANFRGMVNLKSDENFCVDSIIQKAVFEVNEWGAEAAAASVVKMKKVKKSSAQPEFVAVRVDHPSIFMLTYGEGSSANILFYGRLSHPIYC